MKTFVNMLPALAVLLAGLGVASCTQEETVAPAGTDPRKGRVSAGAEPNLAGRLLTKQDNFVIARRADGELARVTYSPQYYVTYRTEVSGDPVFTRTIAVTYKGGVKTRQIIYHNKGGKTTEAITMMYNPQTGVVTQTVVHGYMYNEQGRLIKRYDVSNVQDRIDFAYNSAGNLTKVMEYTPQGALQQTTQFYYSINAKADPYGFYPDVPGIDPFPQVLGVFSQKLPTSVRVDYANPIEADANLSYTYALDAEGYPTSRSTFRNTSPAPQWLSTRTYGYRQYN